MARSDGTRVAIIGGGLMGTGLARLFSGAGWGVSISEPDAASRARLSEAFPAARVTGGLAAAVADADLVIEAAPERIELKQSIFAALAEAAPAGIPLATNSSVIPVAGVSARLSDAAAARVLGAHFWNPPDVIPLVEVIQAPRTGMAAVRATMDMLRQAGKEPVHIRTDTVPGNRMQHALWREAMALVDEGVCAPEEVDHIVKRSFGLRLAVLGPLENADLVGLELTEDIHRVVLPTLSRAEGPAACLLERRARGENGVRSGKGFYSGWTAAAADALRQRVAAHLQRLLREK